MMSSFVFFAYANIIPINLHFQKLSGRLQLRAYSLPSNYIFWLFMKLKTYILVKPHLLFLGFLSKHQHKLIKGPVVDMDNCFNKVFSSFDPLNSEFVSGVKVIDTFSSCFSFHMFSKCNKDSFKSQVQQFDEMAIESSNSSSSALVITDVSIKNNIATSILYVYIHNKPITKTLHHTVNITSTEAELFAIRYGINQATML